MVCIMILLDNVGAYSTDRLILGVIWEFYVLFMVAAIFWGVTVYTLQVLDNHILCNVEDIVCQY